MRGWFLPECEQTKVKAAVWDIAAIMGELGGSEHTAGRYRFRYTTPGRHRNDKTYFQIIMTVSRRRRRLGWKPILKYIRYPVPESFRIRMDDLWMLADAYRELTEYYEDWAARQELDEELTEQTFEDFGPPRERLE